MISIIDYGVGNLHSVLNAVKAGGASAKLISTADEIINAEKIILPGVGAYGACMDNLSNEIIGAINTAINNGTPLLGICVGMQILSTTGEEFGGSDGLNIISGRVRKFNIANEYKIPHMGWNKINVKSDHPVLDGLNGTDMYFVHSYVFDCDNKDNVLATCEYGEEFNAVVGSGNVIATQFHPEKSQTAGLKLIDNFVKWKV
ncbi:MAG: imidazole glycerol phosphate synthase subunit HisH [Alphaproteobacteria bacterium]